MTINRKWTGATLLGLTVALLVSFQNCSNNQTALDSGGNYASSGDETNPGISSAVVPYPSVDTPLYVRNGQKITLKVAMPSFSESSANYMWYAYNDANTLFAKYGLPVYANGYMYITLSVRTDFSTDQNVRILLYNFVNTSLQGNAKYLDQKGIWVIVKGSSSAGVYSTDALSESCAASTALPTFRFTRTAATAVASLVATDNGGGIASATCTFGSTTVDCFKPGSWPSSWNSSSALSIYTTTRCGGSTSYSL